MVKQRKGESFGDAYILLNDSQEIEATAQSIGQDLTDYSSLFVLLGEGEYLEIWGSEYLVPYLCATYWQIL